MRAADILLNLEDMTMRTFDLSPLLRSTVGFDRLATLLDSVTQGTEMQTNYPPYNIERRGEHQYRITMAVAGFSEKDLNIETADNTLTISGSQKKETSEADVDYLHQGIASRSFERKFQLDEHVKVRSATLENGLLTIDLVQEIPEAMKPRKIEISHVKGNTNDKLIEGQKVETSKAA